MSWLLPQNKSARVVLPSGPSKTYSFSTLTQGNFRRCLFNSSRSFENLFFFHEQFLAGGEPVFLCHNSAVFGSIDGLDFGYNGLLCFIWDTFQTLPTRDSFDPTDARLRSIHLPAGRTSSDHPGSQF